MESGNLVAWKLALITVAAAGLGLATAKLFANHGADFVLVDISPSVHDIAKAIQADSAAQGKQINVSAHVCDVVSRLLNYSSYAKLSSISLKGIFNRKKMRLRILCKLNTTKHIWV